jgi:hypothetical protein
MAEFVRQPASEPALPPTADKALVIDELLVSGLDHYFAGQYELAIQAWTRIFFIDRGHARARAYIERARNANAERQRETEELVARGLSALRAGDEREGRRLLTTAVARGGVGADALAALDELDRASADCAVLTSSTSDGAETSAAETPDAPQRDVAQIALACATLVLLSIATLLVANWDWLGRWWQAQPAPAVLTVPMASDRPAADRRN